MMGVTHKSQVTAFRSSVFHLSASILLFFFKPKYKQFDVGGLYEFLAQRLTRSIRWSSSSVNFTLINLYSAPTGFSHGCSLPPADPNQPANRQLVFTFAYDIYDDLSNFKVQTRTKKSNAVSQFGDLHSPDAFISIGLSVQDLSRFGLHQLYAPQMAYLYNILGVMTKSLALHPHYYAQQTYGGLYSHGLKSVHDKIGTMSLYQLISSVPYCMWVFSPAVWEHGGNLLTPKMLTPHTALYYFLYIHGHTNASAVHDRTANLLGTRAQKGSVLGYLAQSIESMVQNVATTGYIHESALDVLAPSVLLNTVLKGNARIEQHEVDDARLWDRLKDVATTMSTALSAHQESVSSLLMPPQSSAKKLFGADASFVAKLTSDLDFSEIGI